MRDRVRRDAGRTLAKVPGSAQTECADGSRTRSIRQGPVGAEALALEFAEPVEAGLGEVEQGLELGTREGPPLAGPLDLDQSAAAEPDDVQVDLGLRVLGVVEVEDRPRPRRSRR